MKAQDSQLPYYEISDYPEDYEAGSIAARMIDGLGFRYYWATEGLTQKELDFKPSEEARNVMQTLQHIYGMSNSIKNASNATPNKGGEDISSYSYAELREKTLRNLKTASDLMKGKTPEEVEAAKVIFQNGENQSVFPYWNLINGMLADCIYHTGQITMMRRTSGNPINPNISVFSGKVRN